MCLAGRCWVVMLVLAVSSSTFAQEVTRYVRYEDNGKVSYGILEGQVIHELEGDIFTSVQRTGKTVMVSDIQMLAPTSPQKVIAVGFNYVSHLSEPSPAEYPGLFAKYPTSVIPHDAEITYYADATDLHYEGEMVLIIGKTAKNVSADDAAEYIFAVAPGNDVSERVWQQGDLQWFRAKGADTFGPVGPVMVAGIDYNDLMLQTRLNGEVMQAQRTKDLIFSPDEIVSYVSTYVTLEPGDMIFTGTPGSTSAMQPGDVVEIELEHAGVLRNTVGPKQE